MTEGGQKRFPMWPLLVLPVVALIVIVGVTLMQPGEQGGADNAASMIPALGANKLPQPGASNAANEDSGGAANEPAQPTEPEKPADQPSTAHEIDAHIAHLAHATRVGDGKGKGYAHDSLKKCNPDKLVNERLLAAMQAEQYAPVRVEFFIALHGDEARDGWAWRVMESSNAKYFGTDDTLTPGEADELLAYLKHLVSRLPAQLAPGTDFDPRLLAFLRNLLNTEKPEWALEAAIMLIAGHSLNNDNPEIARKIENELRRFLERATAPATARNVALLIFAMTFADVPAFLRQLEAPALRPYVSELLLLLRRREVQGGLSGTWINRPVSTAFSERVAAASDALAALCKSILEGAAPAPEKALLIQRLGEYDLAGGYALIEAGLQRRDGNLGDYLAAFGRCLKSPEDIKRLVEFTANADAAIATGAIQGLRQCGFPEAAEELKRLIEQANNPGIQSQALGALLQRDPSGAAAIVETYLGPEREAAVRAVAVAHIPEKNLDRMKKVVEEDASPRVRQAALARLGAMRDTSLRTFFHRVMMTENNLLLAQEAKKYHEQLKQLEEEEKARRAGQR